MNEDLNGEKEYLISELNEIGENYKLDVIKITDILEEYSEQHKKFKETANNDDGNEDHPDTYNSDGDDVQGCDRGEEIVRINNFLDRDDERNVDAVINKFIHDIENAKDLYEIDELKDDIESLKSDLYDNYPDDI